MIACKANASDFDNNRFKTAIQHLLKEFALIALPEVTYRRQGKSMAPITRASYAALRSHVNCSHMLHTNALIVG